MRILDLGLVRVITHLSVSGSGTRLPRPVDRTATPLPNTCPGSQTWFASAKETYGISLSHSTTTTTTWSYSLTVPSGETAKAQVFHSGYQVGIEYLVYASCKWYTQTSETGNYYPSSDTSNNAYCIALVRESNPGIENRSTCTAE